MSVFLTPDLVPVAGGTYFPPEDQYGRVGFSTMLQSLAAKVLPRAPSLAQAGNRSGLHLLPD